MDKAMTATSDGLTNIEKMDWEDFVADKVDTGQIQAVRSFSIDKYEYAVSIMAPQPTDLKLKNVGGLEFVHVNGKPRENSCAR